MKTCVFVAAMSLAIVSLLAVNTKRMWLNILLLIGMLIMIALCLT